MEEDFGSGSDLTPHHLLYYFLPLLLAMVCYLLLEGRAKNEKALAR
jgi:uncharacterized membrane protein YbhN (UPF0104 family)